jgi:hypothetical protein
LILHGARSPAKLTIAGLIFLIFCFTAWLVTEAVLAQSTTPDSQPQQDGDDPGSFDPLQEELLQEEPQEEPLPEDNIPDLEQSPSPPPPDQDGTLMEAGGPSDGPAPRMPNGECPKELPVEKDAGCYAAQ